MKSYDNGVRHQYVSAASEADGSSESTLLGSKIAARLCADNGSSEYDHT